MKNSIKKVKIDDTYPVLQKGEYDIPFRFYKSKKALIELKVGMQDGIFVGGYHFEIIGSLVGCCGGGNLPGRKWGEYSTLKEAELDVLDIVYRKISEASTRNENIKNKTSAALKALEDRRSELLTGIQLPLF